MMKEMNFGRRTLVLLVIAGMAVLAPVKHAVAQTITPAFGDLILGFRATGSTGDAYNLEVDLGAISNLYDAVPGAVIPLPELAIQDLVDIYGPGWASRTDLFWGAVSTTGRTSGTPDGHAPKDTLWATDPNGEPAWDRDSQFTQGPASANIEPMYDAGSPGTLNGATPTTNSAEAAVLSNGATGSWGYQETKTTGTSFGYFNPTIDSVVTMAPGGRVLAQLYELQPGSGAGTLLGYLSLTQTGLVFEATPPTPAAFNILSITKSGTGMNVTWVAPGSTTNFVEAKGGNYSTNGFTAISGMIINAGTVSVPVTNTYNDPFGATNRPSYFYRVSHVAFPAWP